MVEGVERTLERDRRRMTGHGRHVTKATTCNISQLTQRERERQRRKHKRNFLPVPSPLPLRPPPFFILSE